MRQGLQSDRSVVRALIVAVAVALAAIAPPATAVVESHLIFANGFENGDIVLPFGSTGKTLSLEFDPADPSADFVISMDTTGTMDGEITNVRNGFSTFTASAGAIVADTQFAV